METMARAKMLQSLPGKNHSISYRLVFSPFSGAFGILVHETMRLSIAMLPGISMLGGYPQ